MKYDNYYCRSCGALNGETVVNRNRRMLMGGMESVVGMPPYTVDYVEDRGHLCQWCRDAPHPANTFNSITGEIMIPQGE